MKRIVSSFLFAAMLLSFQPGLSAQDLETGYFLGGNPYAFRLNPAFQSERSIFSIGLGETGLGSWSNLGFSTLLYPDTSDGHLYSFLNDRVDASDFLRKLSKRNLLDLDARVNVLTLGFWSSNKRFITLDFNLRSLNAVSVPYDMFCFWKEGAESRNQFDFSGLGIRSQTFAEAAFGWSKNYGDVFNVGFRVKALVGALELNALARNMKLAMSNDRWEVQAQSYLYASSPSLTYRLDENGDPDLESIGFDDSRLGPAGYGGAVDLGVSWNVLPELTLSASALDLGAIRWNREIRFVSPDASYVWSPSENGTEGSGDWEAELNEAMNGLSGAFRFKDAAGSGSAFEALPFHFFLGAEYRMPFYDRLSVGALYSGRTGSAYARHEGRVSLNWNPLTWMSMSTGTTLNQFGKSLGFALNLHPAGLNLLVGCDYIPLTVVDMAPLLPDVEIPAIARKFAVLPRDRMKLNVYVSLNLAFGRRHVDHRRRFIPAPVKPTPEPDVLNDQDSDDPEGTPVVREIPAETI